MKIVKFIVKMLALIAMLFAWAYGVRVLLLYAKFVQITVLLLAIPLMAFISLIVIERS